MLTFWKVTKLKYKQPNNLQDHLAHAAEKSVVFEWIEAKLASFSFIITNKISNAESWSAAYKVFYPTALPKTTSAKHVAITTT